MKKTMNGASKLYIAASLGKRPAIGGSVITGGNVSLINEYRRLFWF
jgi:hypothetical protein